MNKPALLAVCALLGVAALLEPSQGLSLRSSSFSRVMDHTDCTRSAEQEQSFQARKHELKQATAERDANKQKLVANEAHLESSKDMLSNQKGLQPHLLRTEEELKAWLAENRAKLARQETEKEEAQRALEGLQRETEAFASDASIRESDKRELTSKLRAADEKYALLREREGELREDIQLHGEKLAEMLRKLADTESVKGPMLEQITRSKAGKLAELNTIKRREESLEAEKEEADEDFTRKTDQLAIAENSKNDLEIEITDLRASSDEISQAQRLALDNLAASTLAAEALNNSQETSKHQTALLIKAAKEVQEEQAKKQELLDGLIASNGDLINRIASAETQLDDKNLAQKVATKAAEASKLQKTEKETTLSKVSGKIKALEAEEARLKGNKETHAEAVVNKAQVAKADIGRLDLAYDATFQQKAVAGKDVSPPVEEAHPA